MKEGRGFLYEGRKEEGYCMKKKRSLLNEGRKEFLKRSNEGDFYMKEGGSCIYPIYVQSNKWVLIFCGADRNVFS